MRCFVNTLIEKDASVTMLSSKVYIMTTTIISLDDCIEEDKQKIDSILTELESKLSVKINDDAIFFVRNLDDDNFVIQYEIGPFSNTLSIGMGLEKIA